MATGSYVEFKKKPKQKYKNLRLKYTPLQTLRTDR